MSNATTISNSTAGGDRFPSLAALRAAHSELLKLHRERGKEPEILAEIEHLIYKGRATGAVLDSEDDRWAAQSLLDYWNSLLYRAAQEPPDATLVDFDPSLAPDLSDDLCPYMGLEAFREKNKNLFFGRQRLINKLLEHLETNRLLIVVGSSGSGKSSVVLGGLLPRLLSGGIPGSQNWAYFAPLVPGSDPLTALAWRLKPLETDAEKWVPQQIAAFKDNPNYLADLVKQSDHQPVVLVIDQFEEVFTLCLDEEVRQAFIKNLLNFIQNPEPQNVLILTMRTDFESQFVRTPELLLLFEESHIRVTALDAGELRETIEKPAEMVGLKFDEGLVDTLLSDVLGEPAALPLLQFTLLKLWDNRDHNRVTWEAYRRLGGGRLALARSADKFYNNLIPEEQLTAKRILLRMVRPSEGLEVTNNRIPRKELFLSGEARDRVDRVLDKLIQARLVRLTEGTTPDNAQVEVAHEALIRNWPQLVDWLEDERLNIRQRLRLTAAAEQWQAKNREPSLLLRGAALGEVLSYRKLNELESEFIRSSKKAQRKRRLQLISVTAIISGLAVVAIIGVLQIGAAEVRVSSAQQQAKEADQQRIIAEEQKRQAEASIVAAEARLESAKQNYQYVQREIEQIENQRKEAESELQLARQASARADAQLEEARQSQQRAANAKAEAVRQLSQAEEQLALAQTQLEQTQEQRQEIELRQQAEEVYALLTRSPEQGLILAIQTVGESRTELDKVPEAIQESLHQALIANTKNPINLPRFSTTAISPDGQTTAVVDNNRVKLVNKQGDILINIEMQDPVTGVIFSPDGQRIVTTDSSGIAHIWDLSGTQLATLEYRSNEYRLLEPDGSMRNIAFSPDGRFIATACSDGTVRLWNLAGQQLQVFPPNYGIITSIAFSPDGNSIAIASSNGTAYILDHSGSEMQLKGFRSSNPLIDVNFSSDGQTIAAISQVGTSYIWNLRGTLLGELSNSQGWRDSLSLACNLLRDRPILANPRTQTAMEANTTCQEYGWN